MLSRSLATRLEPDVALVRTAGSWLPQFAPGDAAVLSALYRHRRPIAAQLAGHVVAIEAHPAPAAVPHPAVFRLVLGERPQVLRIPSEVVALCARALVPEGFDRLGAPQAGMLLELAMLGAIKALEARMRMQIRITERIGSEHAQGPIALHLRIRGLPSGDASVSLFLDRDSARAVAAQLDEFATPNAAAAQLPLPVRICGGLADLTLSELRSVRPGDIVLAGRASANGQPVAVIADYLAAELAHDPAGFRIVTLTPSFGSTGDWLMQQPIENAARPALEEVQLEQLPVRVVFELGRLELALAEVRRLAPGYLLPLARPEENAVDIVANGRRIAYGSLVKIGDSIGVRVERLIADA